MPNGLHFQSLPPGYRTTFSQSYQRVIELGSGSLFSKEYIEKLFDPKSNW